MPDSSIAVVLLYYVLPVVTVVTALALAYWVYTTRRHSPGAVWFIALLVSGAGLNAGLLVTAMSGVGTVERASFLFRNVAFAAFVASFVLYASAYTGRNFHRRPRIAGALTAVFGGYALLAVTNPLHRSFFVRYLQGSEPFEYLHVDLGMPFVAVLVGLVAFVAYATYVMVVHLLSTERRAGWQIVLVLLGVLSIAGFEMGGEVGLFPAAQLSHSGYGVLPVLVFLFLAIYQFDLLDVQPVARTTVVEELRDPVLVLDAERRVVDFNDAATRVWPDVEADLNQAFETVCPGLARAIDVPPATDRDTEHVALTADGQDRHYSVTVSAVSGNGGETALYSILFRDVTDLEQSRRQLQTQNERLDQVASTVSHDLRNPIQVADNHVELIPERVDTDGLDPDSREHLFDSLQAISTANERMESIIEDVLTMAREGKTVEATETVALSAVAHGAWETVETADASLSVADDSELQADRSKVLRIFENLFRNALDHGPDDVAIEVGATDDGFYVQDDGPGIPPAERDHVFEYGYTTSQAGTGLGLSIVRTMAESHGWSVDIDDGYADGTRFVFETVGGGQVLEPQLEPMPGT